MKIDATVRRAAADAAQLALAFGSEDAADAAMQAALASAKRLVTQQIIDKLQLAALSDVLTFDERSVPTLTWFATELQATLTMDDDRVPYVPEDGDVIQVTLTGVITEHQVGDHFAGTMWELDSAEGILIPLGLEDFETLGVIKLALC